MKDGKLFVARRGKCRCYQVDTPPICICTPLKEFLEFSQTSTKPYRNTTLQGCQFSLNPFDLDLFWTDIGSNLTTLKLDCCRFTSIDELRKVLYKSCPLLQKLCLKHCIFPERPAREKEDDVVECTQPLFGENNHLKSLEIRMDVVDVINKEEAKIPLSWLELFSYYPSLTSLDISCDDEDGFPDPEFEALTTAIRTVRKTGRHKLPLKRFSFFPHLTISPDSASHRRFALVQELRLPLTEVKINVRPELDQRFVTNTLGYLAASVNSITMFHRRNDNDDEQGVRGMVPPWFPGFPFGLQLNKLTSLSAMWDFLGSFTFLKYAPNLSILLIREYDGLFQREVTPYTSTTEAISNTCKTELTGVKMLQLTEFKLDFIISDDDMQHLVKWMPNITNLGMVLNDKQFGLVCQNWKNVERLEVVGNRLTAKGVVYQQKGQEGNEATGVGSRPDVANLEKLKQLHVRGVELSQKDVFDLFLHLPILEFIVHQKDAAFREDLDLSAYQEAIEDNTADQWFLNLEGDSSVEEDVEDDDDGDDDDDD